jgi:hypothetical protein
VVPERECQEQFDELSHLQAHGIELCLAIFSMPRVRNHLLERMRVAAFRRTKMAREPDVLQAAVSSAVELVLGRSPDETIQVDVVSELIAEFWRLGELCSLLERHGSRIYDLLLGPSLGQARWADRLNEDVSWLAAELAAWQEVDIELEEH